MQARREQLWVGMAILLFLIFITLPYLLATPADSELAFSGFLVNPIDGHSYLAKMRQGYEGSWTFMLPYTAEPGEGAAVNLYYLFLGHLARVFGWSLIFTFHAARIAGAAALAFALYRFFARTFVEPGPRLASFVFALFSGGLGWLAAAFGLFTSDFWVAEAFPFLASYTNPHFSVGLALQLWLLAPLTSERLTRAESARYTLAAAALSVIYPFGWALSFAVLTAWMGLLVGQRRATPADRTRWLALIAGIPYAVYAFLIINSHSMLSQWNAQNLTPAPSPLDLLFAFSPAFLIVVALLIWRKDLAPVRFLLIWLVVGLGLLYIPVNLQRRLISGLYVPVIGLAIFALWQLVTQPSRRRMIWLVLLLLALPTNAITVLSGVHAVRNGQAALVVSRAELAGYAWLDDHAASNALVLAAPDTGTRLPAYANVSVLYGHPFETLQAEHWQTAVTDFFVGEDMHSALEAAPDYIFYGPRERELGTLPALAGWQLAYDRNGVQIWAAP